ncbi:hypothetical protein [Ensifer sp. LCM 4579]|uniref:hypothetical protein n=1 Tax=Ensifer sp. LCM 4579 TaxID=1848292 RepID=UPI0008D8E75E|nr:hypothetical protein [Ensifer sp. LCM 4579]OHV82471.1 hypothetical protein LCM4579_18090 [Ensifer sp. LCM 4579]
MADDADAPTDQRRPSDQHQAFLARLSAIETIVVAVIALIAIAGIMLIGKGFYMKATASLLQSTSI